MLSQVELDLIYIQINALELEPTAEALEERKRMLQESLIAIKRKNAQINKQTRQRELALQKNQWDNY